MPDRVPLGTSPAGDTEAPPSTSDDFPLHTAISLIAVYLLGHFGWHWSYVIIIFWLLVTADGQRQRRQWAVLQREARASAAAAGGAESATWINELVRAVWPLYEVPLARYAASSLQPLIDRNKPTGIGIKAMRIRSFSFGSIDPRRTDGRHRLAPLLFDKVQVVSKSAERAPGSRDPRPHRVRYVLLADVRWHAGAQPALVLDVSLGPKFVSIVSVDAEVRDFMLTGTLRVELDWTRPYPWLGRCYISFIKTPAIDFKLSLGGSPDVMHLAPPLRNYLKSMLDQSVQETMVGSNRLQVPLSDWYGEGGDLLASVETVTAAEMAAPYAPPTPGSVATPQSAARSAHRMSREASFCAPTAGGMLPPMSRDDSFASAPPSSRAAPTRRRAADDSELPSVMRRSQTEATGAELASAISRAVANRLEKAADSRREAQRQAEAEARAAAADAAAAVERGGAHPTATRPLISRDELEDSMMSPSAIIAAASEARKRNHRAASNSGAARAADPADGARESDRSAAGGGEGSGQRAMDAKTERAQPISLPPSPRAHRRDRPSYTEHASLDERLQEASAGRGLSVDQSSRMGAADIFGGGLEESSLGARAQMRSPARAPAGFMTSDEFFGDSGAVGGGGHGSGGQGSGAGGAQSRLSAQTRTVHAQSSSSSIFGESGVSPAFDAADGDAHCCQPLSALPPLGFVGRAHAQSTQSVASSSDGELTRHLPKREALAPPSPLLPSLTSEPPHRHFARGTRGSTTLDQDLGDDDDEVEAVDAAEAREAERAAAAAAASQMGGLRGALMNGPLGQWALATWERGMQRGFTVSAAEAASAAAAARSAAIASGAVGEVHVEVLHATGLVTPSQRSVAASLSAPNLAPTLIFGLAVGDETEIPVRGAPINASAAKAYTSPPTRPGAPRGQTTRLEVEQTWRIAVHDSLTQRLRVRVLIKEIAKELSVLGDAEMPLADLRLNVTASKAVVLPISGRRDPALLHLRITYMLLAAGEGHEQDDE